MRKHFFHCAILCLCLALAACGGRGKGGEGFVVDGTTCRDLRELPQDLLVYASALPDTFLLSPEEQALHAERARGWLHAPWRSTTPGWGKKDALWGYSSMSPNNAFIAKDEPFPREEWERLRANCNAEAYPSRIAHGITVKNTSLRAMPTSMPFFRDPRLPGEGYPFDYFQHTSLWVGTPVLITHMSRDGRWVLAETRLATGWMPVGDMAFVDEGFKAVWEAAPLLAITRDQVALSRNASAGEKASVVVAHIGTLLPAAQGAAGQTAVLLPTRGSGGNAILEAVPAPPDAVEPFPLPLTARRIARLGNEIMGQTYGWGGIDEKRDCSAMTHDLLLPFGIWLPRNSAQQAAWGRAVPLATLNADMKEQVILAEGVPFFSLIWLRGHIGLYLGEYKGKPLMFHDIWGIRLARAGESGKMREGRAVIGKAVVTTLRPGAELPDVATPTSLLDRIERITILPEADDKIPAIKPVQAVKKKKISARKTAVKKR